MGLLLVAGAGFYSFAHAAAQGARDSGAPVAHGDPVAPILFSLVFIALAAALGGYLMRRLGQPPVLGELLVGMIVANVAYFFHQPVLTVLREGPEVLAVVSRAWTHGVSLDDAARQLLPATESTRRVLEVLKSPAGPNAISVYQFVDQLSRIGMIVLLFLVGLETSVQEMRKVGRTAFFVAVVGVVCPLLLGLAVMEWFEPQASLQAHLFIGGILTATSVGITARVFRDLHQSQRTEAKIVLGASVIDDVLGLIILAVASDLFIRGMLSVGNIFWITCKAAAFLLIALGAGTWLTPRLVKRLVRLKIANVKLLFSLGFAFVLAWLANRMGLATIVGAFAAGLVVKDFFFVELEDQHSLRELLSPLESLIVPVYFVFIGMQVKLETFAEPKTLWIAAGLTVAAVIGKLVSGFVCSPSLKRWVVGIAMMPRGEVGLIFASIGRSLGAVDDATFSAVVAMVMVTTFLASPLLKWSLKSGGSGESRVQKPA